MKLRRAVEVGRVARRGRLLRVLGEVGVVGDKPATPEGARAFRLALGKARQVPAAIVRGVDARGDGSATELVMPRERDLFR